MKLSNVVTLMKKGLARWFLCALLLPAILLPGIANAEFLGSANGRTADLTRLPDLSLEGHFNTGDFDDVDYQNIGLRVNFRLSPGIILIGDLGMSEIGVRDGTAIGFGAYYALAGIFENIDAAVKASYHMADYGSNSVKLDVIALDFLFSGLQPISDNGLMWYANVGLHRHDAEVRSDTEFAFGGGVVLPVSTGEAYFGIDLIDELVIGLGYRYFFQ